ncbi:MAG: hyaluronan synthase [Trebonia sp.]|nr:hyaluronan synthase [Trebonia sp.]
MTAPTVLTDEASPAGRPTAESQLAGLAHLRGIAVEQSARAMSHLVPPAPITIPFERVHDAVPEPVVARGDGRHRLGSPRRRDQARLAQGQERDGELARWRAERKIGSAFVTAFICVAALSAWGLHHAWEVLEASEGRQEPFAWAYGFVFVLLAWQMIAACLERPVRGRRGTGRLMTAVAVPVFNEDQDLLARCLASVLSQSRRPDFVLVTDDGSAVDYSRVRAEFEAAASAAGVVASWERFPVNRGKRDAQAAAFRGAPQADIYITVDSDAILDYRAIAEGLKPFADSRVQSVAGVLLVANHRRNLLTRATELWYVTSELADRSAQSAFRSVLVNTGTFALYRAGVVRASLDAYVSETFFGRPVQFSDDSLLTFYALLAGKAVQQPTAIGFTAMPETLSHHARQYLRWMRGMTIRTFWRFRYLPLSRYAYWQHMFRWVQAFTTIPLFLTIMVAEPAIHGTWSPRVLVVVVLVGYGRSLRYLTVRRYDDPWWSQLLTWLLAPVVAVWQYTVLRGIWWYGIATCLRTGWGTRQHGVEVALEPA